MKGCTASWAVIATLALIGGCGGGGGGGGKKQPDPPPADTIAPTVSSTSPGDGASDAGRLDSVTSTFSEGLNASTVNASSFTLVDASGSAVSGTVSFDAATRVATFLPDSPLSLIVQYTATLSTAITDAAGNALANAVSWSFTIADGDWGAAVANDQDAAFVSAPRVAVDADGNVVAVWFKDEGTGIPDVWSNRYSVGTDTWSVPELLESSADLAIFPLLAMDSAGNAITVWEQIDATTGDSSIWANTYTAANGSWGTAELISDAAAYAQFPQIEMDAGGNAIAVWMQEGTPGSFINDIRAAHYSAASGAWANPELLETATGDAFSPVLAMDAGGNGIVAWNQEGVLGSFINDIHATRYSAADGTWSTAQLLENSTGDAFGATIAIAASGDAAVVWEQESAPGTLNYDIRANQYSFAGDVWGTSATLDGAAGDATGPRVGIDAESNVTVVWRQDDESGTNTYDILANRMPSASGVWGTAELIDAGPGDVGFPQVAVGVGGDSVVVWRQINATGLIDLNANTYSSAAGAWGTTSSLESEVGDVSPVKVATDAAGNAIVVWAQNDAAGADADVWANRYQADTDAWSTAELLSSGTDFDSGVPQLTMHPNGIAAAAWQQFNTLAGTLDIYTNRFD